MEPKKKRMPRRLIESEKRNHLLATHDNWIARQWSEYWPPSIGAPTNWATLVFLTNNKNCHSSGTAAKPGEPFIPKQAPRVISTYHHHVAICVFFSFCSSAPLNTLRNPSFWLMALKLTTKKGWTLTVAQLAEFLKSVKPSWVRLGWRLPSSSAAFVNVGSTENGLVVRRVPTQWDRLVLFRGVLWQQNNKAWACLEFWCVYIEQGLRVPNWTLLRSRANYLRSHFTFNESCHKKSENITREKKSAISILRMWGFFLIFPWEDLHDFLRRTLRLWKRALISPRLMAAKNNPFLFGRFGTVYHRLGVNKESSAHTHICGRFSGSSVPSCLIRKQLNKRNSGVIEY